MINLLIAETIIGRFRILQGWCRRNGAFRIQMITEF